MSGNRSVTLTLNADAVVEQFTTHNVNVTVPPAACAVGFATFVSVMHGFCTSTGRVAQYDTDHPSPLNPANVAHAVFVITTPSLVAPRATPAITTTAAAPSIPMYPLFPIAYSTVTEYVSIALAHGPKRFNANRR